MSERLLPSGAMKSSDAGPSPATLSPPAPAPAAGVPPPSSAAATGAPAPAWGIPAGSLPFNMWSGQQQQQQQQQQRAAAPAPSPSASPGVWGAGSSQPPPANSFPVGSVWGIPVRVHYLFPAIIGALRPQSESARRPSRPYPGEEPSPPSASLASLEIRLVPSYRASPHQRFEMPLGRWSPTSAGWCSLPQPQRQQLQQRRRPQLLQPRPALPPPPTPARLTRLTRHQHPPPPPPPPPPRPPPR